MGFDCQNEYSRGLVYDLKRRWELSMCLNEECASFISIKAKIKLSKMPELNIATFYTVN